MRVLAFAAAVLAALVFTQDGPARAAGTLDKIKASGKMVIGHRENSPPFSFLNAAGVPSGYSIDLCKQIAAAVQTKLGPDPIEVVYRAVSAEERMDLVENGEIDILCGSTTKTLKRQERFDFSLLTFITGAEILVAKNSGISGLADLEGKAIGVVTGTTTEAGLTKALKRGNIAANVVKVEDHDQGLAALENGEIQAYTGDRVLLIGLALRARNPGNLTLTGNFYSFEPYALMLRRGDDDFRLLADRTLAELYRSAAIVPIYERWFGPIKTSASDLLKALFVLNAIPEG